MNVFQPTTEQELFACQIAQAFDDDEQLRQYIEVCNQHPLELVRQAFLEAQAVPPERVRKSRPAIFFYLVKFYANQSKTTDHPRP